MEFGKTDVGRHCVQRQITREFLAFGREQECVAQAVVFGTFTYFRHLLPSSQGPKTRSQALSPRPGEGFKQFP